MDGYLWSGIVAEVDRAVAEGRIAGRERHEWEGRLARDPSAVERLRRLHPVGGPGGWMRNLVASELPRSEPAPAPPREPMPDATASGLDPVLLHKVPAVARKAIAREPDRAKAHELFERYSDPETGEIEAELDAQGSGPLARDAQELQDARESYERDLAGWQARAEQERRQTHGPGL